MTGLTEAFVLLDEQIQDEDDHHIWCPCSPQLTLCGLPWPPGAPHDDEEWDQEEGICPLCAIGDDEPCPRCGE